MALRAVLDAETRSKAEDHRTPAQRRADGLGEVCRQWLDRSGRPTVAGERPHLTITVGAEVLAAATDDLGGSDNRSEMDHVGPVSPSTVRRLSCDASLMRVVMGPDSEPLDVGRRTPSCHRRSAGP